MVSLMFGMFLTAKGEASVGAAGPGKIVTFDLGTIHFTVSQECSLLQLALSIFLIAFHIIWEGGKEEDPSAGSLLNSPLAGVDARGWEHTPGLPPGWRGPPSLQPFPLLPRAEPGLGVGAPACGSCRLLQTSPSSLLF